MNFEPQSWLAESEAVRISGVSLQTLQRFSEAGYLQVRKSDLDQKPQYSLTELKGVFGFATPESSSTASPVQANPVQTSPTPPQPTNSSAVFLSEGMAITESTLSYQQPKITTISEESRSLSAQVEQVTTSTYETQKDPQAIVQEPPAFQPSPASTPREEVKPIIAPHADIDRLRAIVAAQEKMLAVREAQLEELRKDRDWLRSRIEKLEEKSDRDQIILLSETQTIRKLLVDNRPKSTLRTALEWFGVTPNQSTSSHTQSNSGSIMSGGTVEVDRK